ncbi:MAG: hypothetical protein J5921_01505 [Clostridia bacterium]|nr:hypothetical protein [Clostridia bacterium]
MGFFDVIKKLFSGSSNGNNTANNTNNANNIKKAADTVAQNVAANVGKGKTEVQTFTFAKVPKTLDELKALPEAKLDTPFKCVALTMLVLLNYKDNQEEMFKMLDYLNGPEPVTPYTRTFMHDRLKDKEFVVASFFKGSSVANDYTPTEPYTIDVKANPYSFDNENYATLWLRSSGADNERSIALRKKPSTGEWFFREIQCLGDIRKPVSKDAWA